MADMASEVIVAGGFTTLMLFSVMIETGLILLLIVLLSRIAKSGMMLLLTRFLETVSPTEITLVGFSFSKKPLNSSIVSANEPRISVPKGFLSFIRSSGVRVYTTVISSDLYCVASFLLNFHYFSYSRDFGFEN